MRITDVHIHQPCGLLRLRTDTELEGWCPGVDESSAGHILRSCRDTVVGADPMERERLWNELVRLDRFAYLPHSVWGFLDVALWDLAAKACGVPVFRLIGGFRDRLPAYKMGPNLPTVSDFVEAAVMTVVHYVKPQLFKGQIHLERQVRRPIVFLPKILNGAGQAIHLLKLGFDG